MEVGSSIDFPSVVEIEFEDDCFHHGGSLGRGDGIGEGARQLMKRIRPLNEVMRKGCRPIR